MENGNEVILFLFYTDTAEVTLMLIIIGNSKSTDKHDIQIMPDNYAVHPISHCVPCICNISLLQGYFPTHMQKEKVSVIYQKDGKNTLHNYRPIPV